MTSLSDAGGHLDLGINFEWPKANHAREIFILTHYNSRGGGEKDNCFNHFDATRLILNITTCMCKCIDWLGQNLKIYDLIVNAHKSNNRTTHLCI